MIEFDLKESKQTFALCRLLNTLHSTDNIIDIFTEANKQLSNIVKCDYVNILLNNEKGRYFYINNVLNQTNAEHSNDVIIPYSETAITDILRVHQSIIRNNLSERGELTPGDLKFLPKDIKSDLSAPIINKNKVLGVVNLSSYQSYYFSKEHQHQTEQIASLLGLALERSQLIERLNQKQTDLHLWKNKFTRLINNITEAVAIVRLDHDLIYETNDAFQKLTEYTSDQIHGMRLSHLHPQHQELILTKLDKEFSNGKATNFVEVSLLRKDGVQVPVKLRFVKTNADNNDFAFAIYKSIDSERPTIPVVCKDNGLRAEIFQRQLSVFREINNLANTNLELNDVIKAALIILKRVVNFDYAQITLFDVSGENIQIHTMLSDHCREYSKQKYWTRLEDCESYWYNFSYQHLRKRFTEKGNDSDPIEQEIKSRVSEVLMIQNRYLGTFLMGNLEPNFYQKQQIEFLGQITQQLAILIENIRFSEINLNGR